MKTSRSWNSFSLPRLLRLGLIALGMIQANPVFADSTIYDFQAKTLDGAEVSLEIYKGKLLLVVNTASRCGFTPQYKGLEEIFQRYKDRGFMVLGFPSNDFMGQEPGSNAEIKDFCKLNYDVTFPMMTKGVVSGEEKQPVYKFLTESNAEFGGEVRWNFEKFLVGRDGRVVDRFRTWTGPTSEKITARIEEELAR